jgi:prevent-host-death family protein
MDEPRTYSFSAAREKLATLIDEARMQHEPVFVTRRGHRVAAIVDADDLDTMVQLAEDMADIRAAEAARSEMIATGDLPIPWEQVKADLGLN